LKRARRAPIAIAIASPPPARAPLWPRFAQQRRFVRQRCFRRLSQQHRFRRLLHRQLLIKQRRALKRWVARHARRLEVS
jgi:hypothetical protein